MTVTVIRRVTIVCGKSLDQHGRNNPPVKISPSPPHPLIRNNTGGQLLPSWSSVIQQQVKWYADLVAPYGGEEFAVILPSTPVMGAFHVTEGIRQGVRVLEILHENSLGNW